MEILTPVPASDPLHVPHPHPASTTAPESAVLGALGLAQLLFAHGRRGAASAHLAKARALGRRMGSPFYEYLCHLLGAQFAMAAGKPRSCHALLRTAMALGRQHGFVDMPYWTADTERRVLAEALRAGIEVDHVRALIRARGLALKSPAAELEHWPWAVRVYTLGRLAAAVEGQPRPRPLDMRGAARRPAAGALALLELLVAAGKGGLDQARVGARLGRHCNARHAAPALDAAITELESLLGARGVVLREGQRVRLDSARCWVDAWAFERVVRQAGRAEARGRADQARELRNRALSWYRGGFMATAWGAPADTSARERLHELFLQAAVGHCAHLDAAGDLDELLEQCQQLLTVDETAEPLYRFLIRGLVASGQPGHAARVYERCRQVLGARLGVQPAHETRLLRALVDGGCDALPGGPAGASPWPVGASECVVH